MSADHDMKAIPPELFREVLGHLPTGVTVITATTPDGPDGMALNAVTSVSLDPPLVLACPAKSSTTWPRIRQAGRFCINVMGERHGELTRRFATKDADRFTGVSYTVRPCGPALDEAIAWIECIVHDEHDAGDHTIVVAEVLDIEAASEPMPLVFFRGRFGTFAAEESDLRASA